MEQSLVSGDPAFAPVKVAVADERRLMAEALAALIRRMGGFSVTGVVQCASAVCELAVQRPDIVVVGMRPGSSAARELVQSIGASMPELEIVVVAEALDSSLVRFVVEQQVAGLLLTCTSATGFATSLDEIAQGRDVMPAGWQRMLFEHESPLESLSPRQMEVLTLLAAGCSYEEIGARLFITLNTVKFHVKSIFLRLGVPNRMAAARILVEFSGSGPLLDREPHDARGDTYRPRPSASPPLPGSGRPTRTGRPTPPLMRLSAPNGKT
jgi:DNA-binding NarL/FixJ family response regulator